MSLFSHTLLITKTGLTLLGALLSGCSSPSTGTRESPATTLASPAPTAQFPFGSRVDSLNGIAGHSFGQPLTAFPKIRLIPPRLGI